MRRNMQLSAMRKQKGLFALHNIHASKVDSALGIVHTNAIPSGARATKRGLSLHASRISNACCNNAQNAWNPGTRKLTINS